MVGKLGTILTVVEPIISLLRQTDSELPLMGKVYHKMSLIATQLESSEFAPGLTTAQRRDLTKIHTDCWSYLHNFYHAAGYALDPEFSTESVFANDEIMTGFRTVCERLFYDKPEKAAAAKRQFVVYKNRSQGVFMKSSVFEEAKDMPAHSWWEMYGSEVPELQYVAMHVLSKRSSACSVERLWSLFGLVWSDQRARLGVKKAIDLVKTGANLRLQKKLLAMDYESEMRSWSDDPENSDDESDGSADAGSGAAASGDGDGARSLS